jgi:uncharacterized membrane protein (UPF0127 family)
MEKNTIEINDTTYNVFIADTPKKRSQGLQKIDHLKDREGMIFIFDEEDEVDMWMEDTLIPLDIIFMNQEGKVLKVHEGEPLSDEIITQDNTKYVLELNVNSGVKVGHICDLKNIKLSYDEEDEEFDEEAYNIEININISDFIADQEKEEEEERSPMLVLDARGRIQMELDGGERIFSRKNTKTLISMAKRAFKDKTDSNYKRLGKKAFSYLKQQDERESDYVEIKKPA